ncbi:MAG: rRNA pseudouridine synthase [Oscillospiraceae bacterium]|nr:rRNA pseudouridine synthase [Oscillospiraceae bacterium]
MRLDKFTASQKNISRKEAGELIRRGRVTVGGIAVKKPDMQIDPESDEIALDGMHILYRKNMYIMLNKPAGVICATRDELSRTVTELIPPELYRKGLFPAGRLDKDTEGFVFITDDGETAHRITSPAGHVEKEYIAALESPAKEIYPRLFAEGLVIDGGEKCLPAKLILTEDDRVVRIILREGKYHQVKRMAEAVGNKVASLKRVRIGGLWLDEGLALGECREILHNEIQKLCAIRQNFPEKEI